MINYKTYANKNNLIENPKKVYNKYWTNYCDFLNIDTSNYVKTKNKIKDICNKKNIQTLKEYNAYYLKHKTKIPYDPCEYYNVRDFSYFLKEKTVALII